MYTRREFAKLSLAALPAASLAWKAVAKGRVSSNIGGVQIGVETYSYRSLRDFKAPPLTPAGQRQLVDKIAENIAQDGINYCEFWIAFVEPFAVPFNYGNAGTASPDPAMQKAREELQKWRTSSPHDIFEYARKKFEYSGIKIYSAMFNFTDSCTDDELDAAFGMAKALGTDILSANSTMAAAKRAAPLAEKHNIRVGLHSERELGTAENLREAMKLSPNMCVTLDIGHFTAANGDSVKFLTENHSRIVNLHIKDRYRNDAAPNGNPNDVKWGAGDAPIKPVLRLVKERQFPLPSMIEYEYKGAGTPAEEVRNCFNYIKSALT